MLDDEVGVIDWGLGKLWDPIFWKSTGNRETGCGYGLEDFLERSR